MNPEQKGEAVLRLSLSALLSQALVAFTIEFDNEFEHRMPHRTAKYGSTTGSRNVPWLISLVMWSNCMRFVGEEGVTVRELQRLARTGTNLAGMQRWGYIVLEPDPTESRSKRPGPDTVVRPTRAGRKAQEIGRPLFGVIEERWRARFGKDEIDQLRKALWALISKFDIELPDCLPILGYGLFSRGKHPGDDLYGGTQAENEDQAVTGRGSGSVLDVSDLPLSALLSRALLAFAIDFERDSPVSLAISANVLRVLDEQGVQLRDLPHLTGVSKEAISMAMGILQEKRLAEIDVDPSGSRFKMIRLTSKGLMAQRATRRLIDITEERWQERFGKDNLHNLRESLECLVTAPTGQESPLFKGLDPYPDCWRSSVRKPTTLPHYPMVLHRGGFPDGS